MIESAISARSETAPLEAVSMASGADLLSALDGLMRAEDEVRLRRLKDFLNTECVDRRSKLELMRIVAGETFPEPVRTAVVAHKGPRKQRTLRPVESEFKKRCERIFRFLARQRRPTPPSEISRALRIAPGLVKRAVKRLREEGRVELLGAGGGTRYVAKAEGGLTQSPRPAAEAEGTLQGRILMLIKARSWVSEEELVQATGAGAKDVEAACAALVAEEEIEIRRIQGRDVYVIKGL